MARDASKKRPEEKEDRRLPDAVDYADADAIEACEEILTGLLAEKKHIPSKYFYDERGSRLFEEITRLEEYYPSRTEKAILARHAADIVKGADGRSFIEFGSGDCSKISILFDALHEESLRKVTYIPVDVSLTAIEKSERDLQERFGAIEVRGIVADFMRDINLVPPDGERIFCFFGSTIGNLDREEGVGFVARVGGLMKKGDRFLLGLDMVKDKTVLQRAYNDDKGVTASFNRNILNVANEVAGTDFYPDKFDHDVTYNDEMQRIELRLTAAEEMAIRSPLLDRPIHIRRGESIHTENCHKFTEDHVREFAEAGCFAIRSEFTDTRGFFTLVEYTK